MAERKGKRTCDRQKNVTNMVVITLLVSMNYMNTPIK